MTDETMDFGHISEDQTPEQIAKQVEQVIDTSLEPETLTEKTPTKTVPCRRCRRACIVTLFATAAKTECNTCRGRNREQQKQAVQIKAAHTVDPATLDNLADALINPPFATAPHCPFDPEHFVELKSVCHSPTYGPRKLLGYKNGMPLYEQQAGESVVYQCNDCRVVISYSTMHPVVLQAQNEARRVGRDGPTTLTQMLGERRTAA